MQVLDSKVSAEGRVSLPADVRHQLGVAAGDRVQFLVLDDGTVQVASARQLAEQVWAANPRGGSDVDAVDLLHAAREASGRSDDRWDDEPFEAAGPSGGEDVLAALFPGAA